jgi:oxaloacetate decarboxylase alpha subunit
MADIELVETSLRDGNQSLWAALGLDTARTLTIAPVMDAVGFKAIDFTTSTHMGVAVRYKREIPWSASGSWPRQRRHAAAVHGHRIPLHRVGDASLEFMALAYRTARAHGIRRFCLADR